MIENLEMVLIGFLFLTIGIGLSFSTWFATLILDLTMGSSIYWPESLKFKRTKKLRIIGIAVFLAGIYLIYKS